MKRVTAVAFSITLAAPFVVWAQTPPPTGQKTLAATMNIYAFPTKGQAPEQQSQDEAACYSYATQQTGTDPFQLQKQAEAQKQQTAAEMEDAKHAGEGAAAKGAVKGAAAGALIGSVASGASSGQGAAYGAAAGVLVGHRRKKEAQAQATQQAEQSGQQAQAATQQQLDNFKKAFSVCLEAKSYMVKY